MSFDPTLAVFPQNFVNTIGPVLEAIDSDLITLVNRPLRPSDPNFSIGVYGTLWQPEEDSYEIGHVVPGEATLNQYQVGIQTLLKHGDAQELLNINSVLSYRIRTVLYRNQPLRLALGSLKVEDGAFKESLRRWGIRTQRYMSNDIEGTFVTSNVLDLWIETEMS